MSKKRRIEPAATPTQTPASRTAPRTALWIGLALAALNLVIYAQSVNFGFVTWDDPQYVTENPNLVRGLTPSSAWWALTTTYQFYWHPLTWLSYLLDFSLFGLNAGGYHAVNVLLHMASTWVLFEALRRMTGKLWPSALVAALIAVHPLHVESVAWISERKDVLSTLFWMLTLWAYAAYVRKPGVAGYLRVAVLFVLGLMAKPMLVTLPFALLLLDYWPLGRLATEGPWKLVREKLPLSVLSAAASVMTFYAQSGAGAVAGLDLLPLPFRLSNAILSYVKYLGKTIWPSGLAALYPFLPVEIGKAAAAFLLLIAITAIILRYAKARPYLAVGWFWYLGTLVPVIGFVQVGGVAMADRFTYVPHVGLFVMLVWGAEDVAERWKISRRSIAAAACLVLAAFTWVSLRQVRYWSDSVALWENTLASTVLNYRAHNNLATELRARGRRPEAAAHFQEALRIRPNFAEGHNNLGGTLAEMGRLPEAVPHYEQALRYNPNLAEAHNNLGVAYANQGRTADAVREMELSLRLNPAQAGTHSNLGVMLETQGRIPEAIQHFRAALALDPAHAEARNSLNRLTDKR